MKKYLFLAAVASMGLAGCVNEVSEVASSNREKEIRFSAPVTAVSTKAPLVDNAAYPTTEKFTVWAVWSNGNLTTWEAATAYMGAKDGAGVEVSYNKDYNSGFDNSKTGGWHAATPYYWPKNGVLSFAAVSPSSTTATYGKNGLTIENYTVTAAASANQVDLMFSKRSLNKTTSMNAGNSHYDGVDIKFHHALSQIMFTAKTDVDANTKITLKKVELTGVINKGSFAENITDGETYNCPATTTDLWAESTTESDRQAYTAYSNDNGLVLTGTAAPLSATYDEHNQAQLTNTSLMLIPQSIPAEQGKEAKIKVTYTITPKGQTTPIEQVVEANLSIDGLAAWNWGTRYTYHLTISLEEIYFAPSVMAWTADNGTHNISIQ